MKEIKLYYLNVNMTGLDPKRPVPTKIKSQWINTEPNLNWYDECMKDEMSKTNGPAYINAVLNIPEIQYLKSIDTMEDQSFYRTSGITLPQNKVALLKSKYNVSIKRNLDKADYMITSNKYWNSLFHKTWDDYYSFEDTKLFLSKRKDVYEDYSIIENFFDSIEEDNEDLSSVFISLTLKADYYTRQSLSDDIRSLSGSSKMNAICPYYLKDKDSAYSIYNYGKIVSDEYMLSRCNEDSIIISPEDLKNISVMIKSDDLDNAALALEMMANCNIEKSYDKIALIFAFYPDYMKRLNNWNSVNVKSMRIVFKNIPEVSFHYTYGFESLLKNLHRNNALTKFAEKVIIKKLYDTTLSRVGLTRENSIFDFNISDLKLKKDFDI